MVDCRLLSGKVAVVTGASRGIGEAVSKALAMQGARVFLTSRDELKLKNICEEIKSAGGLCEYFVMDVTNTIQVEEVIREITESETINIWVNNAGISSTALTVNTSDEVWDEIMHVNLSGTFRCCREISKFMMRQNAGKIINIASVAAEKGLKFYSAYSASKHGILGLTRTLALELAPYNIQVNAVSPGVVETEMIVDAISKETELTGLSYDSLKKQYIDCIPLGRLAHTSDIANTIIYLSSDFADYITGINIPVAGGEQ